MLEAEAEMDRAETIPCNPLEVSHTARHSHTVTSSHLRASWALDGMVCGTALVANQVAATGEAIDPKASPFREPAPS